MIVQKLHKQIEEEYETRRQYIQEKHCKEII